MAKRQTTTATTKDAVVIATDDELSKHIDEIATIGVDIDAKNAAKEADIQDVLQQHEPAINEQQTRLDALVKACELYVSARRVEIFGKDKKSAKTTLATYGYRLGQPTLKTKSGWTWDKVVALLLKTRRKAYVIAKYSADKDAIRLHVKEGKLGKIGLKIEQKETFYIERTTEA